MIQKRWKSDPLNKRGGKREREKNKKERTKKNENIRPGGARTREVDFPPAAKT